MGGCLFIGVAPFTFVDLLSRAFVAERAILFEKMLFSLPPLRVF